MPTKSNSILVVGGAGYIGSHMVVRLQESGYRVVVLDNLSKGHKDAVLGAKLIVGEMSDKELVSKIIDDHAISAVMHFAAYIEVGESVRSPGKYYQNNVASTLSLLEVMREKKIKKFIFSSTAAVYGEPQYTPIDEKHPLAPINPYGSSKWMVERMLHDYAISDGLRFAVLRYFNAAGADPAGRVGECHEPESHLIPLVLQVAAGLRDSITVYGEDYPTPDGTCVRDYVHVSDLCSAHLLALQALDSEFSPHPNPLPQYRPVAITNSLRAGEGISSNTEYEFEDGEFSSNTEYEFEDGEFSSNTEYEFEDGEFSSNTECEFNDGDFSSESKHEFNDGKSSSNSKLKFKADVATESLSRPYGAGDDHRSLLRERVRVRGKLGTTLQCDSGYGLIYNLGNGHGYSVQQVIEAARRVTNHPIPVVKGGRRQGDPAVLVADASKAMNELQWRPMHANLDTIVQHAWDFMRVKLSQPTTA